MVRAASNYFYLPIEDEGAPTDEDDQIPAHSRHIDSKSAYEPEPSSPCDSPPPPVDRHHGNGPGATGHEPEHEPVIAQILAQDDLYAVLGLARGSADASELRRAYLARTKMCHPECVSCHICFRSDRRVDT